MLWIGNSESSYPYSEVRSIELRNRDPSTISGIAAVGGGQSADRPTASSGASGRVMPLQDVKVYMKL